jgi:outer membrane protein OmpA-like peptidoglycan-associated protein
MRFEASFAASVIKNRSSSMAAMTSSILDSLTRSLGSTAYTKAATTFGESDPAVTKGFTVAIASVLAPLVARADNMQFMRNLLGMVKEVPSDVTLLDEPERLFNRAPRAVEETGPVAMLRSLVIGRNTETNNSAISRASGVKSTTAAAFFSIALPTVLGYLSRLVSRENLDAAGLGRRLAAERAPLAAVLPANLGSLLSGAEPATASSARDQYPIPPINADGPSGLSTGSSSNGWLAAAIVAVLAVIGLYALFGRSGRTIEGTPGAVGTTGYTARVLPDGTNLRFPAESTEARFLSFLEGSTPVDHETWFEFDRITFETDSATLRPTSREQLSNIAAILKAYPPVRVKIGGYTDNSGDAGANLRLSQSRAEAVMNQLRDMGVASSRLDAEGYGDQHPIADNSTPEGRAKNRRVAVRATQK